MLLFPDRLHLRLVRETSLPGLHQRRSQGRVFPSKRDLDPRVFCLSSKAATCVPSRSERISLQNAGLGRRKVVFSCKTSALDVKENLESGGFELLRSAQGTFLSLTPPPPPPGGNVVTKWPRPMVGLKRWGQVPMTNSLPVILTL